MRKLTLVAVVWALAVSVGVATVTSAQGMTTNRGTCMKQLESWEKPYQAPGKNGAGPLTIVETPKGVMYSYGSFDGAVGCSK